MTLSHSFRYKFFYLIFTRQTTASSVENTEGQLNDVTLFIFWTYIFFLGFSSDNYIFLLFWSFGLIHIILHQINVTILNWLSHAFVGGHFFLFLISNYARGSNNTVLSTLYKIANRDCKMKSFSILSVIFIVLLSDTLYWYQETDAHAIGICYFLRNLDMIFKRGPCTLCWCEEDDRISKFNTCTYPYCRIKS